MYTDFFGASDVGGYADGGFVTGSQQENNRGSQGTAPYPIENLVQGTRERKFWFDMWNATIGLCAYLSLPNLIFFLNVNHSENCAWYTQWWSADSSAETNKYLATMSFCLQPIILEVLVFHADSWIDPTNFEDCCWKRMETTPATSWESYGWTGAEDF